MSQRRLRSVVIAALILTLLTPALAAALQRGQTAPPIQVTSTTGQRITSANYRGYVLLVEFFATWCAPCQESIPGIIRLRNRYGKQGLQVLGLSIDERGDRAVGKFISARKITYPVAHADDALQAAYGVRSVPTLFLINRKGQVVEKFMGTSEEIEQAIEAAVRTALAEK